MYVCNKKTERYVVSMRRPNTFHNNDLFRQLALKDSPPIFAMRQKYTIDPGCGSCTSESCGFYEDVRGQSLPPEPPDSEPTNARGKLSYLPVSFICRNVFGKVFILRLILTGSDFEIIIKYYQLTFLHLFFCTKDDFHL